jgi:BirA family biotin operon repressor/biotin-[acetyl-CoA-carboxylase] ligase
MICQTGDFFYLKPVILTKNTMSLFKNIVQNSLIGQKLIYLPSCHSTNDLALEMIKDDKAEDGMIIITTDQIKGRGQRGNKWLTKPGENLTFSIILDTCEIKSTDFFKLSMAISLGIIEGLNHQLSTINYQLKVKWPNDIYFEDKKLGGILIENVFRGSGSVWSVVGIGININQTEFNYLNATSLSFISGHAYDLQTVLEGITTEIEKYFLLIKNLDPDQIKRLYLQKLYKFKEINIFKAGEETFEGVIEDIDDVGKLIVNHEGTLRSFNMQEVKFLK